MITDTAVIIPAINEEGYLAECVKQTLDYLEESSEIVIVTDPSNDSTQTIADDLEESNSRVKHVRKNERHGKGRAIEEGIRHTEKPKSAFMDADLATTPDQLKNIVNPLEEGYDIVIGSRYLEESDTERKIYRRLPSRLFNFVTEKTLGTGIKDHQCGFKAFKTDKVREMVSLEDGGFPWDLELLYRARKQGFEILEVPVKWRSKKGSEVTSSTYLDFAKRIYFLALDRYFGSRAEALHKYAKFASVGAFGALVNTMLLYVFTDVAGLHYLLSAVLAIEFSIISMFFLNNRFTFENVKTGMKQIVDGVVVSNIVRSAGIVTQLAVLYILTDYFSVYYLLSNVIAIFLSSILTFVGENRYNWN